MLNLCMKVVALQKNKNMLIVSSGNTSYILSYILPESFMSHIFSINSVGKRMQHFWGMNSLSSHLRERETMRE